MTGRWWRGIALGGVVCTAGLVGMATPHAAQAQSEVSFGLAGPYLSARQASVENDYKRAAALYSQALLADPTNLAHMENAMAAYVALAEFDAAAALAGRMFDTGTSSQVAHMVAVAAQARAGEFAPLERTLNGAARIGPLVDGLVRAWALVGDGQMAAAFDLFDEIADRDGLRAFALYHKALALAHVGDFEGSWAILSGEADGEIATTRRGLMAEVQILSQMDQNGLALTRISQVYGADLDATFADFALRLQGGETLPFTHVSDAAHGIAEVYYTVSSALDGEAADSYSLLYSRLAEAMQPDHIDALLLSAKYLERLGRHDLATATYDRVPRSAPEFVTAELGRAEALRMSGAPDAAVEVLQQLAESNPDLSRVHIKLGDTLRRMQRYDSAVEAYDTGLELITQIDAGHWFTYFARGVVLERSGRWDEAEADFRTALHLNPDQPQVLNYLGYSLVEQNTRLEEALDLIERAAFAKPDSGHILDSLGWVLYRLGRYEEAVGPMETAVELMATDPTVNDHLGDVYWSVGRETEARFQWQRALSFSPDEEDAVRIRAKLEFGLDIVIANEDPEAAIAVANDG